MKEGLLIKIVKVPVLLIAIFALLAPSAADAVTLSELLRRQQQLQRQAEASKQKIEQTRREASNLSEAIGEIDSDISYTQSRINNTGQRIDATSAVINQLNKDIAAKVVDIAALTEKLNTAYVSLYELSQTTTIEMLLSGNSINDVLSQAQFVQSIQSDLQSDIKELDKLKADLTSQKDEAQKQKDQLNELKDELTTSKTALVGQRSQKNYLLAETKNSESQYQALLARIKSEAENISEEIYRKRQEEGGSLPGVDTYPYKNYRPNVPDRWSFLTKQCTSYSAYKVDGRWYRNPLPPGIYNGHAKYWPAMARYRGIKTGSVPRRGAIIVWGEPGKYVNNSIISSLGHVAYVERVHSNNDIEVSDYNWKRYAYDYRRITPSKYGTPTYIYP